MKRSRQWSMGAACLGTVIVGIFLLREIAFFHTSGNFGHRVETSYPEYSGFRNQTLGWPAHGNTIYGHVHMAKTAGTEINGALAAKYERVCGHKGYSYDALQLNKRAERWKARHTNQKITEKTLEDSITKASNGEYNRGRVPAAVMDEIGYDDCDWISHERNFHNWPKIAEELSPFQLELHVPCRNPIEWLMSMINHKRTMKGESKTLSFSCDANATVEKEVRKSLLMMDRFKDTVELPDNVHLKCFNPIPIQPYVNYMENILQPKRFASSYIHRDTNAKRDKTSECIHSNEKLKAEVEKYLVENVAVFRFCDKCMGSEDDLFHSDGPNH